MRTSLVPELGYHLTAEGKVQSYMSCISAGRGGGLGCRVTSLAVTPMNAVQGRDRLSVPPRTTDEMEAVCQ